MATFKTRREKAGVDGGLPSLYPTQTGGRLHRAKMGPPPKNAEDGYPREIGCFQCGWPLADHTAFQLCPFCGGDNFLGKQ